MPNARPDRTSDAHCPIHNRWLRRLGAGAFLFFLIKGIMWLVVPAALAMYAALR